jgi:hypothetical protein
MEMEVKHCIGCENDKPLTEFYVYKSGSRTGKPFSKCKSCKNEISSIWSKTHPERRREIERACSYKHGTRSMFENKSCSSYLGCVVAETVLSHEFPGFKRMPFNNPNFDYECPKGFLIDVKSSCRIHPKQGSDFWGFDINRNKVPHFFICIAWKDRKSLTPEYLWLIPGWVVNGKMTNVITDSPEVLAKWSKYERPLKNVLECCNKLRGDP